MINNHDFREQLGRRAYNHSQKNWSPKKTEQKFAEIYKKVLS
jgi:hypothetical protein